MLTHSIPTCPLRKAFPSFSAWAPWLQCSGSACHQTWMVLNLSTSAQLSTAKGAKPGSQSGVYIQAGQEDKFRTSLCLQWASTVIPTQDNWILQATKGKAKPKLKGSMQPDEDDIGLNGKICTKHLITNWGNAILCQHSSKPLMFILGCMSGPTNVSKKSQKRKPQRKAGDDDFEDKEMKVKHHNYNCIWE